MSMMSIFRKDLEKFKKKISEPFSRSTFEFDPSTLNDEIAMKIRWTPAVVGGSIRTHRLKEISPGRIEFIARGRTLCLPVVFMAMGIIVMIGEWLAVLNRNFDAASVCIQFCVGIISFLVGFLFFRKYTTPHIFDLNSGYYWKSRSKVAPINMKEVGAHCRLQDIYAIQLLEEYCSGGNSGYSYELNLILKDGKRLNIIDHSQHAHLQSEAQRLGQFLNIPVWDATYEGKKCTKIGKSESYLHTVKFNPSTLNDEIAMKIRWTPTKKVGGGSYIRTHRLKEISPRRIEYIARGCVLCLPVVLIAVGITLMIGGRIAVLNWNFDAAFDCIPFFVGIISFIVGFLFFRQYTTPYIFDLNLGYYWKGRNKVSPIDMKKVKDRCRLQDIHAIQLLEEYCQPIDATPYYSYELNLVLKDGKRLNVMDHSRHVHIRSDANRLGQFLNIPIWDAIYEEG